MYIYMVHVNMYKYIYNARKYTCLCVYVSMDEWFVIFATYEFRNIYKTLLRIKLYAC